MKNLTEIMKQAQAMQARMADMQAGLERLEVEGRAGGGLVIMALNGKGMLQRVTIDPSLATPAEIAVLEDLLVAAHRDAKVKLEARVAEEMAKVTGGIPLPPGFSLPF